MKNCSFCNLTKDDEKWLLLETKYWKLYLSDKQDYIGRCIVISKRHCDNLSNLDNDEWFDLKNIINITEKMCKDVFSADLCNWSCLMNDAYKENPPIAHLHIHIRPRHKKLLDLVAAILQTRNLDIIMTIINGLLLQIRKCVNYMLCVENG